MRVLIAFDKFKDALSAAEACAVAATTLRIQSPDWQLDLCPLTDGGEGFGETLTTAAHGEIRTPSSPALAGSQSRPDSDSSPPTMFPRTRLDTSRWKIIRASSTRPSRSSICHPPADSPYWRPANVIPGKLPPTAPANSCGSPRRPGRARS